MRSFLFLGIAGLIALACSSSDETRGTTSSSPAANSSSSSTSSSTSASTGGSGGTSTGGSAGQGGTGGGSACQWSAMTNPCGNGNYCNAPNCTTGTCEPLGTTDDPTKQAVCGCDNVNYWNAATAAVYGMSVASMGECVTPEVCGGFATLDCPQMSAHFCGYLFANMNDCFPDATGVCWGLPQTCSQIGFGGTWRPCTGNPTDPCLYECDAIKTQSYHFDDNTCPM